MAEPSRVPSRPLSRESWKGLKGRCISCGYLCKRVDLATSTIYEASVEDRNAFNFVSHPESNRTTRIWCFYSKESLYDEFTQLREDYKGKLNHDDICGEIILFDRKCDRWLHYKPFMSPKEHFEAFRMMQLEQERRNFERRMERDRMRFERALEKDKKEFDLKLFKISQKVQEDSKAIVDKSDKFNRKITFWLVLLAILEVAGTLLSLLFPNGF